MKNLLILTLTVLLAAGLVVFTACGGGEKAAKGGANLLSMIPDGANAVFCISVEKLAQQKLFDELVKDADKGDKPENADKIFKNYQDFVDKTGIDPKKDIKGIAIGAVGDLNKEADYAMVIGLNYDKAKVIALIKEKKPEVATEEYEGVTILQAPGKEEEQVAFIDNGLIAIGKLDMVKKIIDLNKGKGQSVLTNVSLKPYIDKFDPANILSFAIMAPEDMKKVQKSPMGGDLDLTKAEALLGHFGREADTWKGEISMVNKNEEANKNIATTLNGLKGMAGMAGPEAVELANQITITPTADMLVLSFSFTDELIDKMMKAIEAKSKAAMGEVVAPPAAGNEEATEAEGETEAAEGEGESESEG